MSRTFILPNLFFSADARPARVLSVRKSAREAANAKPVSRKWLGASLALAVLNMALLFNFLAGVNNYASRGYEIKSLQSKLAALTEENDKINLKVSEVSSMVSIQNDFANTHYVPVTGVKFLQASPVSTAMNSGMN
ncbi:MAG: perilipin family protein [Patescibacteria group bacterium]|nr:perilipin family protein [Patescibacteria group bacterium]